MESTRIAEHIADLERQEAELIAALDRMVEVGRAGITARAATWIDLEVNRQIEGHALRAQELGIERLRKLKAQVTELRDRLPAIVAALISDKKLWPHHRVLDRSEKAARNLRLIGKEEGYLPAVFRDAISEVGSILREYELLDGATWQAVPGSGRYRYSGEHGFNPSQDATFGEYDMDEQRLRHVQEQIEQQRGALAKAKARELYDSA